MELKNIAKHCPKCNQVKWMREDGNCTYCELWYLSGQQTTEHSTKIMTSECLKGQHLICHDPLYCPCVCHEEEQDNNDYEDLKDD